MSSIIQIAFTFLIMIIVSALLSAFYLVPLAEKDHTQYRIGSLILAYATPIITPSLYLYSQYRVYKKWIKENPNDKDSQRSAS